MLLRFRAGNHLSLREPQELSMVASTAIKDDASGLIDCKAIDEKLVPAAIIYGANASGKSNVVKAFEFMRWQVLFSHNRAEPQGAIRRSPFALELMARVEPSVCDIDFVVDGVRYHYGFEASNNDFEAEWLVSYPNGRRANLFSRKGADFTFGRGLKGQNNVIKNLTRANSLFLSAATQNNHEELSKICWFFKHLRTNQSITVNASDAQNALNNDEPDARVMAFLNRIGTGIVTSRIVEPSVEALIEAEKILAKWRKRQPHAIVSIGGLERAVQFGHQGLGTDTVHYLSLDQESAGTLRLVVLLQEAFAALDTGSVMIIDELDASLHTQACEAIVALFCSRKTNPKGAQLIATTHDTNLLRSPLIRRDQIWFTEKDEGGATHLYPLTDIATRQDDNLEKGYLQGRFGAIPFAGSVSDILSVR